MSDGGLSWSNVIGLVAVIITVISIVVPVFMKLLARISAAEDKCAGADAALHDRIDVLHKRVNKVKDDYVRRDDLEKHMRALEEGQSRIERALGDQSKRMDDALRQIADRHGSSSD